MTHCLVAKEHLCKVWWKSIHRQLNDKAEGKVSLPDRRTDRHQTQWSICVAMLSRWHTKTVFVLLFHSYINSFSSVQPYLLYAFLHKLSTFKSLWVHCWQIFCADVSWDELFLSTNVPQQRNIVCYTCKIQTKMQLKLLYIFLHSINNFDSLSNCPFYLDICPTEVFIFCFQDLHFSCSGFFFWKKSDN